MKRVNTSGAKFKIKAVGGTAKAVEIGCVSGEVVIDLGTSDIQEVECFSGTTYSKGVLKFGEGTLNGLFDGDNTDAAQALLLQALYNEGDFATNNEINIDIEFANSKGANGTKLNFNALIKGGKITASTSGDLRLDFDYKQQGKPTIIPAA